MFFIVRCQDCRKWEQLRNRKDEDPSVIFGTHFCPETKKFYVLEVSIEKSPQPEDR